MSNYEIAFNRRVKAALKLLPPRFDRRKVEKCVGYLDYRKAYRSRCPKNEDERKAVLKLGAAHHRFICALRDRRLSIYWQQSFGSLSPLEKQQKALEHKEVIKKLKPRRNASHKDWAVWQAAYLMELAGLPLTGTRNGTFVKLAEALSGERGGFHHHVADYLHPKIKTEKT
jgi:hypothetical protein